MTRPRRRSCGAGEVTVPVRRASDRTRVHPPPDPELRVARRGRAGADRAQGRSAAGRDRDGHPRRRLRRAVPGCGRHGRRRPGALRSGARARAVRHRTALVHAARPQPGAVGRDRRRQRRVRARVRLAVRARPRRRSTVRIARRLRELRQAGLRDAVAAPLRRHRVRTGRRARQQAPPRHGVRPPPVHRQAVHGLGHPAAAAPRTRSRWPASRSAPTSSNRTASSSATSTSTRRSCGTAR